MAYYKPGVEVSYVQGTVSPNLTTPDLPAVIMGKAYKMHVVSPDGTFQDVYPIGQYANAPLAITLSGMTAAANVDNTSIYVDAITLGGARKILVSGNHFTASNGVVTISGGLHTLLVSGINTFQIGYREQRTDLGDALYTINGFQDIESKIGKINVFNPVAFGANLAMGNANTTILVYGLPSSDETTSYTSGIVSLALTTAPYIIAPLTYTTAIHTLLQTHCDSMSLPTNKGERIYTCSKQIVWKTAARVTTTGSDSATMDKDATMTMIAESAVANANRRAFWVYPDVMYVRANLHLSQMKQSYITSALGTYGLIAGEYVELVTNVALHNSAGALIGTTLYAGTKITNAVWTQLQTDVESGSGLTYRFDVLVPVPGYYLAACVAGQRCGQRPEQPLTNVPISGPTRLKYSGDFFSETQLNVAANGGTYWMWQKNTEAPIACRHQLSTDRSSVQKQEMSITSALDYTGKFIRAGVEPYIGRYTISPTFLKMLQMVVSAQGQYLVNQGYLNTFKLTSMIVSSTSADTIECTIEVGVKFPVNYIRFTLIF